MNDSFECLTDKREKKEMLKNQRRDYEEVSAVYEGALHRWVNMKDKNKGWDKRI